MPQKMRYRLALDLGSTSLGWAILRLNNDTPPAPIAVIKAGSRIFSDGRNPKDGSSLAVTRREARAMRRRRDRLLKRKARMMRTLIDHGFFPKDDAARKALETISPYGLRAKGLNEALKPEEFARAVFHINQRRGFKSNRKTDKKDNDSGALKTAIKQLHAALDSSGAEGKPRTVGEYLHRREQAGQTVRARYRQQRVEKEDGKTRIDKSYDLYIDRAMIEAEFDALWAKQSELNPQLFNETARAELKDCLLHQRPLKPVKPGRCTLMPEEVRAPLALPSQQRFRIYQEVNHLYVLREGLKEEALTLEQRDRLVAALEEGGKSFKTAIPKLLGLPGTVKFNLADAKRTELKGNATSMELSKKQFFGSAWHEWSLRQQDAIVRQLINQESLGKLVKRLQKYCGIDEASAEHIAEKSNLVLGYGSLSRRALIKILSALRAEVITYDKAVLAAGFEHHSRLTNFGEIPNRTFDTGIERIDPKTGEVQNLHAFNELPYYGEFLQRHVAFAKDKPRNDEERFGKIANPTVHIGLNQVRVVVNALIKRYGHPSEVIVEVARDLKQSQDQRKEDNERQAKNQRRNERLRADAATILQTVPERVRHADIQKLILWEELSFDPADRRCPYSGAQISAQMVLSDQVEIEHILPFSQTLDDSLNNKTVAMRQANRIKGNRTPWDARADFEALSWPTAAMLDRAEQMPKNKRYRFGEEGYQRWLREDKDFLARALNDTRYLSRVAREYLSLICPHATRVIPGQMTAMLRAKFGLNDILGLNGEKNRNDHRHHAVDACVIAVTDQGMLQRFAQASASARERQLNRLVEGMPLPWGTEEDKRFQRSVKRAIDAIWVSHKPDHDYQSEIFDQTIYNAQGFSRSAAKVRSVIPFQARKNSPGERRHGESNGVPIAYKGLLSNSNYCVEIVRSNTGSWNGDVLATHQAYELARALRKNAPTCSAADVLASLRNEATGRSGESLVMRLTKGDPIRAEVSGVLETLQVLKINSSGSITFVRTNETNISGRYIAKLNARKLAAEGKVHDAIALNDTFFQMAFSADSLRNMKARPITISPIGEIRDPGFKE
ncbi:MAG: type II CRISPR RNA-guided endonuclease Cas9 [Hydrogenophaga sp.]|uniref:type II CRISPR RNA-guided endonuclease Cas9 n=1 Tax=Hydrogenophaga sp. TaxID=1904254 RepID=UPI001BC80373|nr:type II CRISPR RNA-guided endonuclease Cas9 [Hydrogenophaga sp.]MBS3910447.1 type II CRISPR RNA-guided endonuclease Cas9 [Hydrogenophaga sp.]MDP2165612.1 type II CRISPR RNA-guided endonuclease Cas9 [Hydrogenophaga sp.]MDP3476467.1 type II CRISPR RNA-guided endonuclease Cas9 [Hydrogenophaga sp.]